MKNNTRLLIIFALVSFVLGLLWSARTGLDQRPFRQRMERRRADMERLQALHEVQSRPLQIKAALEALPQTAPPELNRFLEAHGSGTPADVRRRESVSAGTGWQARRWEIHFDSIELQALARVLQTLEQEQPPWRLIEGEWHSTDHPVGHARATLILEGLHQSVP